MTRSQNTRYMWENELSVYRIVAERFRFCYNGSTTCIYPFPTLSPFALSYSRCTVIIVVVIIISVR